VNSRSVDGTQSPEDLLFDSLFGRWRFTGRKTVYNSMISTTYHREFLKKIAD
jgi:hypothetical protein